MKREKKILLPLLYSFLIIIFPCTKVIGQININTALTPTQLVQNVLVGGGVTVSNITMTGVASAYGSFTNGNTTNIGLNSGVILTNGDVTLVPGPNNDCCAGVDNGLPGDPDLDIIANATTYDATVLQFDFVPLGDTIKFRYVFGSEEYNEYVQMGFNDVFAFLISGPGIAGPYSNNSKNIALIPGTNTPVSIDNVNNGNSSGCSYGPCMNCAYFIDNCNGLTIQYNAFTTVLTAWCIVQKCQTYHIKLAIADAGDGVLDSGVFLEANSFSTNAVTVTPTYSNVSLGNNAIAGCTSGIFAFTLPSVTSTPVTIHYTIGGTAVNGVDYPHIPSSVTIPAGQDSAAVLISPYANVNGPKTVTITITNGCSSAVYTVNIVSNIPVTVAAAGSTTICPGNPVQLTSTASGGVGPYTYNWNNGGGSGSPVTVSPNSTTTYTVTATDQCGQTATASVVVTISNTLAVSISPANPTICTGTSVVLTASGGQTYTWSPAGGLSATTGATVTASPAVNTTYAVQGSLNGCTGSTSTSVVIASSLTITVNPSPAPICLGGSIQLTASGATNYIWNPSSGLSSSTGAIVTANPTVTSTYTVGGSDASGCTGSTTVTVNVNSVTTTASSTDENCGQSNGTATAIPAGVCGGAGYTYAWSTFPLQNTILATNLPAGTYTVTVSCGACTASASVVINDIAGPSSVTFSNITGSTCGLPNGSVIANGTGGTPPYSYLWNSVPAQFVQTLINVSAGTYSVTITDSKNCTASNSVNISGTTGPTVSIGSTNASCGQSDGTATPLVIGGQAPYNYTWSSNPVQTLQNLQNVPTGYYTLTVTDANGCSTTAGVTVGQNAGPTVTATSTDATCNQLNGTATAVPAGGSGSFTYLWSNTQTNATATGLAPGNYMVTVSDGSCTAFTTVSVGNIPGPTASFTANPPITTLLNGPITFFDNSTGNIENWQWNFGDGSPYGSGNEVQYQYQNIGNYIVTLVVTDNNLCTDSISDTVKVKEIFTFYIPNAFTPNGNGLNDTWAPKFLMVDLSQYDCKIFDRWGNLMYSTANPYIGWNGTRYNEGTTDDAVEGVYVYRIRLKEIDGPRHEYIGKIVVLQ